MLTPPRKNGDNIQWRVLLTTFFIVFVMLTSYWAFIGNVFNPTPYYIWFSTTGPYAVVVTKPNPQIDKDLMVGPPKQAFKAGEWMAWKNDITIEKDVAVKTSFILVNRVTKQPLRIEEYRNVDVTKRTGIKDTFFHIPDTILPGFYEIERKAIFYPPNNSPVGENFTPIPFEVVK